MINNTLEEIPFNEEKKIKMETDLESDYKTIAITQVDLVVTTACNFRCRHCYINEQNLSNTTGLDVEKWKYAIDTLCEQGLISLVVTGGEPLVYKDLLELLDYANEKGLKIQILTNGYLIDEKFIDRIKCYRNLIVQVSLDGSNSMTNNIQRSKNDAFNRTIENIKLLRKNNIQVIVAMVLNRYNVGDIYDGSMFKLCEDLDVNVLAITPTVIGVGNAKKNSDDFLSPFEIDKVINYINDFNKTYSKNLIINVSAPPSVTRETSVYKKKRPRCRRGTNSFSIRPNGDVFVCSDFMEVGYNTYELGNILIDDISDIKSKLSKIKQEKMEIFSKIKGVCSICKELEYCGGACRADAYATYHDINAPYPLCQKLYENGLFPQEKINKEVTYRDF
ncbi:radical SAM/SPASM domain-containing protein [Lutispora thermophila]|uniref:Radical SAM additional 4Fe4S-binding SPASM domain-containing protein n=1 Tax=Lutispora thermophila DSM 19022 TaxID=1122184 RepID=A0A1M6I7P1_9FIRM|nr:radical SAM protein [Lutispora thermophila]SHJ30449.1 radical SAM additional 4Fe4S-binding SPASM domain-containing protein [Lutispora thermophila DSM 19022]